KPPWSATTRTPEKRQGSDERFVGARPCRTSVVCTEAIFKRLSVWVAGHHHVDGLERATGRRPVDLTHQPEVALACAAGVGDDKVARGLHAHGHLRSDDR